MYPSPLSLTDPQAGFSAMGSPEPRPSAEKKTVDDLGPLPPLSAEKVQAQGGLKTALSLKSMESNGGAQATGAGEALTPRRTVSFAKSRAAEVQPVDSTPMQTPAPAGKEDGASKIAPSPATPSPFAAVAGKAAADSTPSKPADAAGAVPKITGE